MTMNKNNNKKNNKNNNNKNNEQNKGTDSQKQIVQWFPGHMAKTRRLIKESLPFVDLVTEIVDARIPLSSSNPELAEMIGDKPRIVLLNKCDVADENVTKTVFKALHIIEVVFELNTNRFDELTELFNSIFSFIEKFIEVFEFLANDKKS